MTHDRWLRCLYLRLLHGGTFKSIDRPDRPPLTPPNGIFPHTTSDTWPQRGTIATTTAVTADGSLVWLEATRRTRVNRSSNTPGEHYVWADEHPSEKSNRRMITVKIQNAKDESRQQQQQLLQTGRTDRDYLLLLRLRSTACLSACLAFGSASPKTICFVGFLLDAKARYW